MLIARLLVCPPILEMALMILWMQWVEPEKTIFLDIAKYSIQENQSWRYVLPSHLQLIGQRESSHCHGNGKAKY